MIVSIINKGKHALPSYSTVESAGMDLRANLDEDIVLRPLERVLIPTGLFLQLVPGTEAQIRPRSGLAYKHGVTVLNSPGTIDSDYRGEVKVILVNLSNDDFLIKDGERICQMVIAEFKKVEFVLVQELDDSLRGEGGFGHTGKH
jgi:dUTP pyrophosphatase